MRQSIQVLLLLLFSNLITAQDGCLEMGMQIFGPSYYGTAYPFVNIMKNADRWHTRNDTYLTGGENNWQTNLESLIDVDENGYPLELPQTLNHPDAETPQGMFTFWAAATSLPAGNYVILYDGEGEIEISGSSVNSIIAEEAGRIEFSFSPIEDYLELFIKSSTLGDHIRNLRVLLPGTESTYQTAAWAASWRDKIAPFKTIRFMEFGATNSSIVESWADRTKVDYYTYGSDESNGVPFEWMIALCNQTQSNAWINIPHLADENYIIQLANLLKNNLNSDLKIYIEYSNETWNWIFDQTFWLDENGDQSLEWPERTVGKVAWALETWTNAFGHDPNRVIRVLGTQGAWFDIGNRQLAQMEADGKDYLVDAIAIGGYLPIDADLLDANSTTADVLNNARNASFGNNNNFWEAVKEYAVLAAEKQKKLLFYEGGHHFTPEPFGTIQAYNQVLEDVQTVPGMLDLYNELFDSLRTLSNDEILFIHHVLVSPKNGQYGSWGALENQFTQNAPYHIIAPKYQAILDNIEDCQTVLAVDYLNPLQAIVKNDKILIKWTTNYEENNSHFIIHRSLDGQNWENIGKVAAGKNNASTQNQYKTYDVNPQNGNLYYRLQQFDNNGTFFYSKIASVFFQKNHFTLFPNPTKGALELTFPNEVDSYILVHDLVGKIVFQQVIKGKRAGLDLSHLPNGMYLISLSNGGNAIYKKVVIE